MSINHVSKADMIAWFRSKDQIDSLLSFARMREMQRLKPERDRLVAEAEGLRGEAAELFRKWEHEPDSRSRALLLARYYSVQARIENLESQLEKLWKRVERI